MARKDVYDKKQGCNSKACQFPINQGQLNEKIKKVAQSLYEKRGSVPGHELDDWLEAEKIVKRGCQTEISAKC